MRMKTWPSANTITRPTINPPDSHTNSLNYNQPQPNSTHMPSTPLVTSTLANNTGPRPPTSQNPSAHS